MKRYQGESFKSFAARQKAERDEFRAEQELLRKRLRWEKKFRKENERSYREYENLDFDYSMNA